MKPATSRIVSIVRESAVYSIGNFANKLLLFLMVPLYAHHIAPADLSLLAVLDPAEAFLYALLPLGIMQAFFKEYQKPGSSADLEGLISTTFWFLAALSAVAILVLILLAQPVAEALLIRHPLAMTCYYLTVASLFIRLYSYLGWGYFQASRKAVLLSSLIVAGTFLFALYNLVALAWMGGEIDAVFEARLFLLLPATLVGLFVARKWIRPRFDVKLFRWMVRYSYPFIFSAAAYSILNFFDRWMLQEMASATVTGIYDIAYRFGMIPGMLLVQPFLRVWQVAMYGEESADARQEVYGRVFLYYVFAGCVLWLGLSVYSLELLRLFAEEAYYPGHVIIPYVAASQFFYGLGWIVIAGLAVQDKTLFIGLCACAAALLNIGLNWILIPPLGMIGAAIATTVAFFAVFLGFAVYSRLQLPFRWPYGRMALLFAVSLVAFFLLAPLRLESLAGTIALKAVLLLPILLGLALLSGFSVRKAKDVLAAMRARPSAES